MEGSVRACVRACVRAFQKHTVRMYGKSLLTSIPFSSRLFSKYPSAFAFGIIQIDRVSTKCFSHACSMRLMAKATASASGRAI